ncbi:MAG: methyl-accepting chemotaxis protein [Clostridia bacterium]|jgi:methyl-accepting chemotaxis protein|nr:methyl-accepting chemotaxis protein [Clostridia bacterium]
MSIKGLRNGIGAKLTAAIMVVAIVPIMVLGISSYTKAYNGFEEQTERDFIEIAKKSNENINKFVESHNILLTLFLENDAAENLAKYNMTDQIVNDSVGNALGEMKVTADIFNNMMKENVVNNPSVGFTYFGGANKRMYKYPTGELKDYDPTARPWYAMATDKPGEIVWTAPYVDAFTGDMILTIAKSVNSNGKIVGVGGMDVSLANISEEFSTTKIGETGYIYILDSEGTVVAHRDPEENAKSYTDKDIWGKMQGKVEGVIDNGDQLLIFETNEKLGWKIVISVDKAEVFAGANDVKNSIFIISIVTIIVVVLVSIALARWITKNIYKLNKSLFKIASGDLNETITINTTDEFGEMADSFNNMSSNLKSTLGKTKNTSNLIDGNVAKLSEMTNQTAISIGQISKTVEEIAEGATRQVELTSKTANSVNKLEEHTSDIEKSSGEMYESSESMKEMDSQGINAMRVLGERQNESEESINKIKEVVDVLGKQIDKINTFTEAIAQIAEQTNLLSLNASIEAARAGEHGKGFAVVADEIRKLAEQSSASSEEIKNVIESILNETREAISAANSAKKISEVQTEAVNNTKEIFEKLEGTIETSSDSIQKVYEKIKLLNEIKIEVVKNMDEISSVTEQTAAATEEVSATIEEQNSYIDEINSNAMTVRESVESLIDDINKFKM